MTTKDKSSSSGKNSSGGNEQMTGQTATVEQHPTALTPPPAPQVPALRDSAQLDAFIKQRKWTGSKDDLEFCKENDLLNDETLPLVQEQIERYLIDDYFEDVALVKAGGAVVVMVREVDTEHMKRNEDGSLPKRRPPVFYQPFKTFANWSSFYRNRKILFPKSQGSGRRISYVWKEENPATIWLDSIHRPNYDGMMMMPWAWGEKHLADDFFENMEKDHGRKLLNTFDGWPLDPLFDENGEAMPDKCLRIRKHLHNMFCDGETEVYNWVMAWLAHKVQKPHQKIGTAINITGDEGSGKGLIFKNVMGGIVSGSHFIHTGKIEQLTGRFAAMDNALFIFADEAIFTADRSQTDSMKTIITEETLTVEKKFQDHQTKRSYADLGISSNGPLIGGISFNDRRNCVVQSGSVASWTGAEREEYFGPIFDEMYQDDNEGLRAFFGVLLKWDLSKYNLRFPPESKIRGEQKLMAAEAHDLWWMQCLLDENFGHSFGFKNDELLRWDDAHTTAKGVNVVPKAVLYQSYLGYCDEKGEKYPLKETTLWKKLQVSCPAMFELGVNIRARFQEGSEVCRLLNITGKDQLRCLVLPRIDDCKTDFQSYFKSPLPEFQPEPDAETMAAYAEPEEDERPLTPPEFLDQLDPPDDIPF